MVQRPSLALGPHADLPHRHFPTAKSSAIRKRALNRRSLARRTLSNWSCQGWGCGLWGPPRRSSRTSANRVRRTGAPHTLGWTGTPVIHSARMRNTMSSDTTEAGEVIGNDVVSLTCVCGNSADGEGMITANSDGLPGLHRGRRGSPRARLNGPKTMTSTLSAPLADGSTATPTLSATGRHLSSTLLTWRKARSPRPSRSTGPWGRSPRAFDSGLLRSPFSCISPGREPINTPCRYLRRRLHQSTFPNHGDRAIISDHG